MRKFLAVVTFAIVPRVTFAGFATLVARTVLWFTVLIIAFQIVPLASSHAEKSEGDRDRLARIIDMRCLPNLQHKHSPHPCIHVDLAQGYVVMQDVKGSGHYLLVAASPVAGTESPALIADDAPRYFQHAWQHRGLVPAARGEAMDDQSIAILVNPLTIRMQDRMHIHIAPLHRPFAHLLAKNAAHFTSTATLLMWEDRQMHVWKISEKALTGINPLKLVSQRILNTPQDITQTAILLTGAGINARGEKELYLIETYYPYRPLTGWVPEDLLDWRSAPVKIRRNQAAGA